MDAQTARSQTCTHSTFEEEEASEPFPARGDQGCEKAGKETGKEGREEDREKGHQARGSEDGA